MARGKPAAPSADANTLAGKLLREVEQRTEQLALINGVLRTIITGASLPDILRVFASNLKFICPFDRCSISVYDERRAVFHVPYMVMGGRVLETNEKPRPFSSSVLSRVIETRQPVLRTDIREEKKVFQTDLEFAKKGFRCEMLFPLQVGDKPFGTFNVGALEAGRLTQEHLRLIEDVVPAIAVAVWHHLGREKFIFV